MSKHSEKSNLLLFKEYCKIPSLLLRGIKNYNRLPPRAMNIWEILFDLAKFDSNKEIEISINKICELIGVKARSTVESHLRNLEKYLFIKRVHNYSKIGAQQINTYKVLIPQELLDSINTKKISIVPKNPLSPDSIVSFLPNTKNTILPEKLSNTENLGFLDTPPPKNCPPFNDILDNININNCYPSDLEEKSEFDTQADVPIQKIDQTEIEKNVEVLEYYPAEHKPESLAKAVLRHTLQQPVKFEAVINNQLTHAQEFIVSQVTRFWTTARYVSSPRECTEWIKAVLLNPKALSQCGNSFLKKMNVIIKMIREKRFTKPFAQRYKEKVDYQKDQSQLAAKPQAKPCEGLALSVNAMSPSIRQTLRKTHQEQEKSNRIDAFKAQIALAQRRLDSADIQTDETKKQSLFEFIQVLHVRMQEVQYA